MVGLTGRRPIRWRKVASGTTSCTASTATTLGTYTRRSGEVFKLLMFVADNVAINWAETSAGASSSLYQFFARTANPDEVQVKIVNSSVTARVVDWMLVASAA